MTNTKKYEYLMYIQNVLTDRLYHFESKYLLTPSDEETTIVLKKSIKMVDELMKKEGE